MEGWKDGEKSSNHPTLGLSSLRIETIHPSVHSSTYLLLIIGSNLGYHHLFNSAVGGFTPRILIG